MIKYADSLERASAPKEVWLQMVVRRGDNRSMQQVADAIAAGQTVVFALQLDLTQILLIEEELEHLTHKQICLRQRRGRYVATCEQSGAAEDTDQSDFEGRWFPIPPKEVELATALA